MNLTDTKVKNLKPKNKVYRELDRNGLYIEIATSGSKIWRHRYTLNKKSTMISLGYYPEVSLSKARIACESNKQLLRKGLNPQQCEKDKSNANLTFNTAFFEWHENMKTSWTPDYSDDTLQMIKKHLLPYIGNNLVTSLDPQIMLKTLKKIEEKDLIPTLKKIKSVASRVFRYCVGKGVINTDPTRDLLGAGMFKTKKVTHHATITNPKEIGRLLRIIDSYSWSNEVSMALKIAPHIFLRPCEVAGLLWDEIDFDDKLIRISAERMKMDRDHLIPMSPQVLTMLKNIHQVEANSEFVFPSPRTSKRSIVPESLRSALRSLGLKNEDFTTHGFRAMASTRLNELGFRNDLIELQLAHKEKNKVRAAYNHAEYLDDRRKMLTYWSTYLFELKSKVV